MIKTHKSQVLFDYTCKQTHQLGNGKLMNNHRTYSTVAMNELLCLKNAGA